jgi:disulfide bond formation protein DsbB
MGLGSFCSDSTVSVSSTAFGYSFPVWIIVVAFTAVFGAVLMAGPDATDKVTPAHLTEPNAALL